MKRSLLTAAALALVASTIGPLAASDAHPARQCGKTQARTVDEGGRSFRYPIRVEAHVGAGGRRLSCRKAKRVVKRFLVSYNSPSGWRCRTQRAASPPNLVAFCSRGKQLASAFDGGGSND